MEAVQKKKLKVILRRAFALLALPVTFTAVVGMANMQAPQGAWAGTAGMTGGRIANTASAAERVFQSDWGAADPLVYSRIALAFDTEAMEGAELRRVECRSSLCKIVYEANPEIEIKRVLPRQLAESFRSMVTVHAGTAKDNETLVYIDIPSNT